MGYDWECAVYGWTPSATIGFLASCKEPQERRIVIYIVWSLIFGIATLAIYGGLVVLFGDES